LRNTHAQRGFSDEPAPPSATPESLADAVRGALALERQSLDQPASGPAAERAAAHRASASFGRRSGTHNGRSGTSTRGQQPNGCRALRRSGG